MENRQLTNLDEATLVRLGQLYREKFKDAFSTRTITPHYIPGLDKELAEKIHPRIYVPDDQQPNSDPPSSSSHRRNSHSKNKIVPETPPKNGILKERPSSSQKNTVPNSSKIHGENSKGLQEKMTGKESNSPEPRFLVKLDPLEIRNGTTNSAVEKQRNGTADSITSEKRNGSGDTSPKKNGTATPNTGNSPDASFAVEYPDEAENSPRYSPPSPKYVSPHLRVTGEILARSPPATAFSVIMEEEIRAAAFKLDKASPLSPRPVTGQPTPGKTTRNSRKFVGLKLDPKKEVPVVVEKVEEKTPSRPRDNPWNKSATTSPTLTEIMAREAQDVKVMKRTSLPTTPSAAPVTSGSRSTPHVSVLWLVIWCVDWLIDWLIFPLIVCLFAWLIDWLICRFIKWLIELLLTLDRLIGRFDSLLLLHQTATRHEKDWSYCRLYAGTIHSIIATITRSEMKVWKKFQSDLRIV